MKPQPQTLIMTDKPHRKRRGQVTLAETKRDLQASDLEVLRDLQSCCQCSSTQASKMLRINRELDPETPHRKRKRFGPKAAEGMRALLGFASFLAESESGKRTDVVELREPAVPRARSATDKVKPPAKRHAYVSKPVQTGRAMHMSEDGLFGHVLELGDCEFTERLYHLLDTLSMPRRMFIPAVLYCRSQHSELERRSTQTANHIAVAAYIKSSLGSLS